jgi:hypothetical protein
LDVWGSETGEVLKNFAHKNIMNLKTGVVILQFENG